MNDKSIRKGSIVIRRLLEDQLAYLCNTSSMFAVGMTWKYHADYPGDNKHMGIISEEYEWHSINRKAKGTSNPHCFQGSILS